LSGAQFGQVEANWRANVGDPVVQQQALSAFRAARVDAPLDLLVRTAEWRSFIEFADGWFRAPLGPDTGYSSAELDTIERRKGVRFPPTVREWWRIAGKHPCCEPWEDRWDGLFFRPDDDEVAWGDLYLAELDGQTGISFVIHRTMLDQPDPEVFEHNPIADEKDYCVDECLRTGGTVPSIIWQSMVSLISMVEEPPSLFKDDVFCLRQNLFLWYEPGDPDWHIFSVDRGVDWNKLIPHFGLRECPLLIYFNRVHHSETIALGTSGLAVRTMAAMNDVIAYIETQGGNAMGWGTTLDDCKTYEEWRVPSSLPGDPYGGAAGFIEPRTGRRYTHRNRRTMRDATS
jgi:hypothetical protein